MTTEQLVAALVDALVDALGPRLKSVVLYGSAAAGDFIPGVSGTDLLIVAEPLGLAELTLLAGPLAQWENAGNPLPELFTPAELADSADVFPIELADIEQSRRVLHGDDPLSGLKIDMRDYRHQLERELKTRLFLLRRRFLACADSDERLARLMVDSCSTFLVLMRAALRLYNDAAPPAKREALARLSRQIPFDPRPLVEIIELKQHVTPPPLTDVRSLFDRYLTAIEQVVKAVDQHLKELSADAGKSITPESKP